MLTDAQKELRAAASRRYYWKNRERILAQLRETRARESTEERGTRRARHRAESAAYYKRRTENARAATKRWRENNKDHVRAKNADYNAWARATGRHAEHYLKRKYGIRIADYEQLFLFQGGRCAICHQPESLRHRSSGRSIRLAVDHDHITHRVRGLLCRRCNQAIGHFEENRDWLLAAAAYVS